MVPLVLVVLFLSFVIPAQTWLDSLRGVVFPVDITALFAAWMSTSTFWIMLTTLGMAGATFAILKDRQIEDKTASRLSENDSMI